MTKYCSWFVKVADSQRVEWARKNPHPQGVPNGTWWMRGKVPGIPIRRGPWKFGGLPGLIMKIHHVDSLYVFEAVAIEKGNFPIYQYPRRSS